MTHRDRQRRRRGRRRGLAGRTSAGLFALFVLAVGAGVGGLSAVGWVVAVAATTPPIEELVPQDKGRSSQIFAADGSLLGYVVSDEIRTPVPAGEHPRDLRNATVAIEDERFWSHEGVDFEGIVRAGLANLESGKTVQGGSTITQQLVRALYIKDPERNVQRKIREAKLASEMETRRSKQWILKEYLNSVPYGTVNGRTAVGVEAAGETYFAKHAKDLDLAESALLAGLPQAPSQYNPFRNPEAAISRRNQVLQTMIDTCVKRCPSFRRRARRAMAAELRLRRGNRYTKRREPHFFDYVQEQLIEEYGVSVYRRGGLKIHTTIDPKLQQAGREAITTQLGYPDDPSSAIVAIDPKTGYIRAMTSSGTYDERTFNLAAQGHRQPGSAFKTMVLTTALRRGIDPRSTYYTSKKLNLDLPDTTETYEVSTYDSSYGGRMDLVKATLKSDNTVYAQLDVDLGPKRVAETARLMGITTKLDGYPAEGLGGLRLGVSPLEMANAYATLAAGGMRSRPKAIRRVDFPDGKSDELGKPQRKRVFSDGVAAEVTKVLEKNVQAGTGKKADIGCPAAGKTGTTDNFNDAWFVGYTPKLAASVWVGYPNAQREMRGVHGIDVAGGTIPASIWGAFMGQATSGRDCGRFKSPDNPVKFTPFYGRYASQGRRPLTPPPRRPSRPRRTARASAERARAPARPEPTRPGPGPGPGPARPTTAFPSSSRGASLTGIRG
ncbi:MAG: transglycosylase domain-containing protein [Thermoleophilaceae bacterium]